MSSMLIAFLCLCFVSLGWTQTGTTSSTESTTAELLSQQNGQAVFSLIDSLILQDNKITYPEFEKALLQYDSNKDGLISVQETGVVLEKLQLAPSSMASTIFGFIDVRPTDSYLNRDEMQSLFGLFDSNSDGNVVLSEFMTSLNSLQSLIKIFG
ncbi:hypothetical protein CHS0354_021964 [Potamilus streckersoni]|uniref:EF-hand domain-containing protein n=1 Tax=Potamilus streckersoni TaxID=2493646 RepID=A0AAE0SK28_9BIVA|nr:hypothetical protein CHS0354_021964 [Potamilus streckersoni]